jgi:O-antigen/teichoic acid export membrane protein
MKQTMIFAFAMILERVVSFFLLPILTNLVTQTEYAVWAQLIVFSGIMVPVALLGFQTAIVRFYSVWNDRVTQYSIILFMLILILFVLSLMVAVIQIFDSSIARLIFGHENMSVYIPLLVGLVVSEALFELLVGILRASNRISRASVYLLAKGVWRAGVVILALYGFDDGLYAALVAFVSFQLVITLLIYASELKLVPLFRAGLMVGKPHWKEVLEFSLPLVPVAILLAMNTFVDRLFITHFHGLDVLAIYSAGFSLAAIIALFYSVLGFTLFPELSRMWTDGNKDGAVILVRKVIIVYFSLLLPFIIFMIVAGSDFLLILTTKEYIISPYVLFLLGCNVGLFGLYQILFYLFLLQRGSAQAPMIIAIAAAINISCNALLVPEYGMLGAGIAGFMSNSSLVVIAFYLSQKALRWTVPWAAIRSIMIRALLMGLVISISMDWLGSSPAALTGILIGAGAVYGMLDYLDKTNSLYAIFTSQFKL